LFTAGDISIPVDWEVKLNKTMLQMVFQNVLPEITNDQQIKVLDESHVTQMLDLTKRTNRGPFFNKTILLGNYLGIFDNKKLIAMAGQRNKIGNYTEVSAVCTDPGFTGKGYAKKIMVQLMHIIMKDNYIPMLHLFKDNTNALALYFKLGFEIRRELQVYFIQKK
jgi:predicted GNAT family acetyltransferase